MTTVRSAPVHVSEIRIYPIKSLPGVRLERVTLRDNGALADDRRWAMFDFDGRVVNGKRTPRVHALNARFGEPIEQVTLIDRATGSSLECNLARQPERAAAWLSEFFAFPIQLREDVECGIPDDPEAFGPTVIGAQTLEAVAGWFPPLEPEEMRRRFRANLELSCPAAFWEDCLFAAAGQVVHFAIGEAQFVGTNPCQRCVVPTRQSESGEVYPQFAATFGRRREVALSSWACGSRFDHFYRLAVNTRGVGHQLGRKLRVGDRVKVLGRQPA